MLCTVIVWQDNTENTQITCRILFTCNAAVDMWLSGGIMQHAHTDNNHLLLT